MGTSALMGQHASISTPPTPSIAPILSNAIEDAAFIAQNELKIGDVVYTITGDAKLPLCFTEGGATCSAFSPNGELLLVGCNNFAYYFKLNVYLVRGTELIYLYSISADSLERKLFYSTINSIIFSPDGTKLVVFSSSLPDSAKFYSVSGHIIKFISDIYAEDGTSYLDRVMSASFSPDSKKLVVCGTFAGCVKIYSVSNIEINYISDIYLNNSNTPISSAINNVSFSSDGTRLVLVGQLDTSNYNNPIYAKMYSVLGVNVAFEFDIYVGARIPNFAIFSPDNTKIIMDQNPGPSNADRPSIYNVYPRGVSFDRVLPGDNSGAYGIGFIRDMFFSSDGTKLIISGDETFIYSFLDTQIIFMFKIETGAGHFILKASFSPDGTKIILIEGQSEGFAKIYSISENTFTFISNIKTNDMTETYSAIKIFISPDKTKLILNFGPYPFSMKFFSVSDTKITFISDIYMDNIGTVFNGEVKDIMFSPDGSKLIISGVFTNGVKFYSISDNKITFISDVYQDAINTLFTSGENIHSIFSPEGTELIIYGYDISGYLAVPIAKIYSVNGTVVTFISDIYMDNANTVMNGYVSFAKLSPNGSKLILCGYFTGSAKIYSVNGTVVTFISDIYMDNANTVFTHGIQNAVFSSSGNRLFISGFNRYELLNHFQSRVYSVNDSTVTFLFDMGDLRIQNVEFSNDETNLLVVYREDIGDYALGEFNAVYIISGATPIKIYDINEMKRYNNKMFFLENTLIEFGLNYMKYYSIAETGLTLINKIDIISPTNIYCYDVVFLNDTNKFILSGNLQGRNSESLSSVKLFTIFGDKAISRFSNLLQVPYDNLFLYEAHIGYSLENVAKGDLGLVRLFN